VGGFNELLKTKDTYHIQRLHTENKKSGILFVYGSMLKTSVHSESFLP